jgi:4-amino-4-deoxy-L-arabinose transferase-like glycosyltransferase
MRAQITLPVALVTCAVVASLLVFPFLGSRPFWDYDEAIYAGTIAETQTGGSILTLRHAGQPFFEKPPAYFWMSMGLDALLHSPEWSYRMTSAVAGVVCIILTVLIASEAGGSATTALIAGLMLVTTGAFIEAARQVRLDIPAVAAILLAAYCFTRGTRDARWLAGVGIAIAIGFFLKSVVALLAGFYFLAWSIVENDWRWMRDRYLWLGAFAGLVILLPWHLFQTVQYGSAFWDGYLWHNVVGRATSDILGGTQTRAEVARYFLAYTAPWGLLFALTIIWQLMRGDPRRRTSGERCAYIFAMTGLAILTVFMATSTRIFYYLLPAYPFMALAVSFTASEIFDSVPRWASFVLIGMLIASGLWVTCNYAFHRFGIMHTNDLISGDEAAAGESIRSDVAGLPIFAYQYDYWDTVSYYSGGRPLSAMSDDAVLDRPFLLLVSTPFLQGHSFDPELAKHLMPRYSGQVVSVYEFQP